MSMMPSHNKPSHNKTCPQCGQTVIVRHKPGSEEEIYTCTDLEKCGFSEPLPIDVQMRRMDAPQLPGF